MGEKLQTQIDQVVTSMLPKEIEVGLLTRHQLAQIIKKAANQGTLIGYDFGYKFMERISKKEMRELEYQMDQLKERIRELEVEVMYSEK